MKFKYFILFEEDECGKCGNVLSKGSLCPAVIDEYNKVEYYCDDFCRDEANPEIKSEKDLSELRPDFK